jgi:hypothetical protein
MALAPQLLSSHRGDGDVTSTSADLVLDERAPRLARGSTRLLGALIHNDLRPQHFAAAITLVRELDELADERAQHQVA